MPKISLVKKDELSNCHNTPIPVTVGPLGCIIFQYGEGGERKKLEACEGDWFLDAQFSTRFTVDYATNAGVIPDGKHVRQFVASDLVKDDNSITPLIYNFKEGQLPASVGAFGEETIIRPKTTMEKLDEVLPVWVSVMERLSKFLERENF